MTIRFGRQGSASALGRPPGSRNAGYDERRRAIAQRVLRRIAEPGGAQASLRELAEAGGVSVATLRHYFADREGAVQAALREVRALGESWLSLAAEAQVDLPLVDSLRWFLHTLLVGWRNGVGPMVSEALSAGTGHEGLGMAAVQDVLEPILQAVEARLGHHREAGDLPAGTDLRHAALALTSPVVLALLHQDALSGSRCRPLDVEAFVDDHVARFVEGWVREPRG